MVIDKYDLLIMIKLGIKTKIKFGENKLLKSVFIDLYKIKENDNQF